MWKFGVVIGKDKGFSAFTEHINAAEAVDAHQIIG